MSKAFDPEAERCCTARFNRNYGRGHEWRNETITYAQKADRILAALRRYQPIPSATWLEMNAEFIESTGVTGVIE